MEAAAVEAEEVVEVVEAVVEAVGRRRWRWRVDVNRPRHLHRVVDAVIGVVAWGRERESVARAHDEVAGVEGRPVVGLRRVRVRADGVRPAHGRARIDRRAARRESKVRDRDRDVARLAGDPVRTRGRGLARRRQEHEQSQQRQRKPSPHLNRPVRSRFSIRFPPREEGTSGVVLNLTA